MPTSWRRSLRYRPVRHPTGRPVIYRKRPARSAPDGRFPEKMQFHQDRSARCGSQRCEYRGGGAHRVRAAGARFQNASMARTRIIEKSWLDTCEPHGMRPDRGQTSGYPSPGCDLSGTVADRADFSECVCAAPTLPIVARDAMWVKACLDQTSLVSANLMNGILRNVDLYGADLRGANRWAWTCPAPALTQRPFSGALMKWAQMLPAREE